MSYDQDFVAGRLWSESADPVVEHDLKSAVMRNLADCTYRMDETYNVFRALQTPRYQLERQAFERKYRNLWAIARTIRPASLIELGVLCGASADAFLDAHPEAHYLGIDDFALREEDVADEEGGTSVTFQDGEDWTRRLLIGARGYPHVSLRRADLRQLVELPPAEFVSVDAAHDFHNQRRDLELALTAAPKFMYVDDYDGTAGEKAATHDFIAKYRSLVRAVVPIEQSGGGVLLVLDAGPREGVLRRQARERRVETGLAGEWEYRRVGYDTRPLELLPDGRIGRGEAECEQSWRADVEGDHVAVSIAGAKRITCRMRVAGAGRCRGRWLTFERMPAELVRLRNEEGSQPSSAPVAPPGARLGGSRSA